MLEEIGDVYPNQLQTVESSRQTLPAIKLIQENSRIEDYFRKNLYLREKYCIFNIAPFFDFLFFAFFVLLFVKPIIFSRSFALYLRSPPRVS